MTRGLGGGMAETCDVLRMCSVEECLEPVEANGLCSLHRKHATRRPRMDRGSTLPGHPRTRLVESALHLADAPDDNDAAWRLALRVLERAALAYARHRSGSKRPG